MQTVSDTSPLLNLAIIGQLELVRKRFGEVLIPPAVLDELRIDENRPGSRALAEAVESGWLRLHEVGNQHLVRVLLHDLDRGESEAIALAVELEAETTLVDEREGRKHVRNLGLNVTGALGVLLWGRQQNELSSLREAIRKLRDEAGFYIAPALEEEILRAGPNS